MQDGTGPSGMGAMSGLGTSEAGPGRGGKVAAPTTKESPVRTTRKRALALTAGIAGIALVSAGCSSGTADETDTGT